jgi:cobalt/nickel transport system permease protein
MALAHLTVAGAVEFALTAGVVAYLQRANLPLLRINHAAVPELDAAAVPPRRVRWRWAVIGLGAMAVLTPLGLLAPGRAFGEDAPNRFHTLLNGYDFTHDKHPSVGYLVSAGVGLLAIAVLVLGVYALVRAVRHARARDRDVVRDDREQAVA